MCDILEMMALNATSKNVSEPGKRRDEADAAADNNADTGNEVNSRWILYALCVETMKWSRVFEIEAASADN